MTNDEWKFIISGNEAYLRHNSDNCLSRTDGALTSLGRGGSKDAVHKCGYCRKPIPKTIMIQFRLLNDK